MNDFLTLSCITGCGTVLWILYGYFEYIKKKRTHWISFSLLCGNVVLWGVITLLFLIIGIAKLKL